MTKIFLFIISASLLAAGGQVFLKLLVPRVALNFDTRFFNSFFSLFKEPFFFLAVLAYTAVSLFYLKALRGADLNFVYPLFIGLSVLAVLAMSYLFLKEEFTLFKLLGSLIIIGGLILLWLSNWVNK